MTGRVARARRRADELEVEIARLDADESERCELSEQLARVRVDHIDRDGGHGLAAWTAGHHLDQAWSGLHRVEERVDLLTTDVARVASSAEVHVRQQLPRRRARAVIARLRADDEQQRRVDAVAAIHEAHQASERRQAWDRDRQRTLLGIGTGLSVSALLLMTLGAALGEDPMATTSSGGAGGSAVALLVLVILFGMPGGAVSTAVSLFMAGTRAGAAGPVDRPSGDGLPAVPVDGADAVRALPVGPAASVARTLPVPRTVPVGRTTARARTRSDAARGRPAGPGAAGRPRREEDQVAAGAGV